MLCVPNGTFKGAPVAVNHTITMAMKEGWYADQAFTTESCVTRSWLYENGSGA